MVYVIGDIYGCYDQFVKLTNRIEKHDSQAKYILVGNIYGEGPQAAEVCGCAAAYVHANDTNAKYRMVRGEHEFQALCGYYNSKYAGTLENARREWEYAEQYIINRFQFCKYFKTYSAYEGVIEFFKTLPYYIDITVENNRFIIVSSMRPDYMTTSLLFAWIT